MTLEPVRDDHNVHRAYIVCALLLVTGQIENLTILFLKQSAQM